MDFEINLENTDNASIPKELIDYCGDAVLLARIPEKTLALFGADEYEDAVEKTRQSGQYELLRGILYNSYKIHSIDQLIDLIRYLLVDSAYSGLVFSFKNDRFVIQAR